MDDLMGCFLWQELREIAAHHKENDTFPANWGKQPYNTKKNRYRDIVPCEWNHKCIMHIYVTTMHVYMCNDYHIYIMINLVDAPSVHIIHGLIFYLSITTKPIWSKKSVLTTHAAASEVLFVFFKSQNEYTCTCITLVSLQTKKSQPKKPSLYLYTFSMPSCWIMDTVR